MNSSDLIDSLRDHALSDDGVSPYNANGDLVNAAASHIEAQEKMIEALSSALREASGLLSDIDLGRSIHNSRKPDQNIDGPLWAQVPRVVALSRAALSQKDTP